MLPFMPYKREAYQLNQFPEDTTLNNSFTVDLVLKKNLEKFFPWDWAILT